MAPSAGMTIAIGNHSSGNVDSGLRHRLRGTLCRSERDIDDEDAPFARRIANADLATVRPYRVPRDRESKTEARSIAAAPIAKHLKQIAFAGRDPATLVLSLDEQSALFGVGP